MMSQREMSLERMFQRRWPSSESEERLPARDSKGRMVMRLHIVRGSFFTGCAEGEQCAMDAAVWSKMRDDVLWRVLLLLPVVKRVQFQLVSRKWRQLLTSADFHNYFHNYCAAAAPRKLEERVVACVTPGGDRSSSSSSSSQFKVVDIDLSFVPSEFWTSDSYSVVAAADGLVCISNDSVRLHRGSQYCVINPLTRTCILLPEVPLVLIGWLPPTPTSLTFFGFAMVHWAMAAYDLTTGGAGGQWAVVHNAVLPGPPSSVLPTLARCAGRVYWLWGDRVHVLEPGPGGRLVDAVPPLESPLQDLLGPGDDSRWAFHQVVFLVAHRGSVFFVGSLVPRDNTTGGYALADFDVMCGVWRLARDRMEWEEVAYLDTTDVERATGVDYLEGLGEREVEVLTRSGCLEGGDVLLHGAHAVRELVCCQVEVTKKLKIAGQATRKLKIPGRDPLCCVVGFNLDTGEWEQVLDDQALLHKGKTVELNPNFFCRRQQSPAYPP